MRRVGSWYVAFDGNIEGVIVAMSIWVVAFTKD